MMIVIRKLKGSKSGASLPNLPKKDIPKIQVEKQVGKVLVN
jgi:hypothetical protein